MYWFFCWSHAAISVSPDYQDIYSRTIPIPDSLFESNGVRFEPVTLASWACLHHIVWPEYEALKRKKLRRNKDQSTCKRRTDCNSLIESAPAVSDRGWDVNITYASLKCDLQKARKGSNHNVEHAFQSNVALCCLSLDLHLVTILSFNL